jgi:hypothetical protein
MFLIRLNLKIKTPRQARGKGGKVFEEWLVPILFLAAILGGALDLYFSYAKRL